MNGTYRPVDVYVNYHDEPYATVTPGEDQPAFSVDSDADGTYGTYTFEAREKDDPDGEVLAAASVELGVGDSFTVLFHEVRTDAYQLSVYEADLSPSAASRFEIHHGACPEELSWRLGPKSDADPQRPVDERGGTLQRGQWQQALDVTENEYRLEVLVDDEVVAYLPDLDLETERTTVCYVVGDPRPDMGADRKQAHVFCQRYRIESGPERDAVTTQPAEPAATTDDNRPVEFGVEPPDLYETSTGEVVIEATDPDGVVDSLAIDTVEPDVDGFELPEANVERSAEIGEAATATLQVSPDVPPGSYAVGLLANPDGPGERAVHTVPLEVEEITLERLWDRVEHHHGSGAMTDEVASTLYALLVDAGATPDGFGGFVQEVRSLFESVGSAADDPSHPREALEDVVTFATERAGDGIDDDASEEIVAGTTALCSRLGSE